MAVRVTAAIAALALAAAGCGGDDDDESAASEPTGPGAVADITVGEFIAELQPQKQEILREYVAGSEACEGVRVDPGFVLLVTAAAIDADQEAPLADLVEEQC